MLARFFLIATVACLLMASAAFADTEDDNFGRVYVQVLPTVAVYYESGDINMGQIQALDEVCATLTFTVHANGQRIALALGASKLFKDDVPTSPFWIPVDETHLATITAGYGETHSAMPTMQQPYPAGPYGSVTVWRTPSMEFGSGNGGSWSYPATVNICWQGDNAEIFQGDYSGVVILWAQYVAI